ncbi:ATP-binding protein [Pedobacter sp. SAFR-022]|uniref:ATP-binding protein n=1 Tax=Pedobacter sp. SAFR-022 TaxID=3436861 RepID=UPI003F7FC05E
MAEPTPPHTYIHGKGEMSCRIRSFKWETTVLGPINTWPDHLLIAVNLLLDSSFPMLIWWGPDLIQFYNDAYLKILGTDASSRHLNVIGKKGEDCWPETWSKVKGLIERVLSSGESEFVEDELVPIYRNGKMDNVYWTYAYNPLRNRLGVPEGIMVVCTETTLTQERLQQNEQQLQRVLDHMAEGVGIVDLSGRIIYSNPMAHKILDTDGARFPERSSNSPEWYNTHLDGTKMADAEHPTMIAISTGNPVFNYEFAIERPGLERMYLTMNAAPITDAEGRITGAVGMFSDITQRKQTETELLASERRYRTLFNSIDESFMLIEMIFDDSGKAQDYYIRQINPAFSRQTGLTAEACNKKVRTLMPGVEDQWIETYGQAVLTGRSIRFEDYNVTTERWYRVFASPVGDGSPYVVVVFDDITAKKALEQRKDDFISIASHELKTPVTSLKASLQLLDRMKHQPQAANLPRMIEQANRSVDKVTMLIDTLLNATRMSEGQLGLQLRHFNALELLKASCNHIQASSHQFVFEADPELQLFADEHRLEQVLVNLVNNAVKYAPGSTEIVLKAEQQGAKFILSVRDLGPGIVSEKLPHLFDRHYRADFSGMQYSGLGLGLYISAEIVKRHDGEIGVESSPGLGSTFWFSLPVLNA